MELSWIQVGQVVKAERRVMTINPFHFLLTVHGPQRPKSEVGPIRCGKLSKPIYAAMFTNPVRCLHMIGVGVFGKPRDQRTDAEGWDRFYNWSAIWQRSACTPTLRARIAFMFLSKLYRQMYAGTGISTDSARLKKSKTWARWTARQCRKLLARPMPELISPAWELQFAATGNRPAFVRDEPFVIFPKG
jgi:hypothetical protein